MTVINKVPELVRQKYGDDVTYLKIQEDTGLSYPTVMSWMKQHVKRVDFEVLDKWCEYLGVQPGEILVHIKE
jgi:DNA-binding Xre family transcriptional regulator